MHAVPAATIRPRRSRLLSALLLLALVAGYLAVLPGASPSAASPAGSIPGGLADFEDGAPPGFFVFSGGASSVATTPMTVADDAEDARPGQVGDNGVLEVQYDVGDFGGFGQSFEEDGPQRWVATEGFRLWFNGSASGATYTVELSGARSDPATDTSTRYNATVVDDIDGWALIELPWDAFALSTGFQPGGAPLDEDLTLDEIWAWAIVLPGGSGTFLLDDVGLLLPRADDMEHATLDPGTDPDGIKLGFETFSDGSPVAIALESTPPAPILPHLGDDNQVLRMTQNVGSFAGFAHRFTTDGSTWDPQDWSANAAFGFWFHGDGAGTTVFIDILGARNPGSTTDDAQRWTVDFRDDTPGWSFRSWDFSELGFKNINNGAPAGNVFEPSVVYGWAVGTLATGQERTYYVDDLVLLGDGGERPLFITLASANVRVPEGDTARVPVRVSRPLREGEGPLTVDYATEAGSAIPGITYDDTAGSLTFVEDGPTELAFEVTTYDDTKRNHDRTIITRLSGNELLVGAQGRITVLDDEVADPTLLDDVEQTEYEFDPIDAELSRIVLERDDERARPDQDRFEGVLEVAVDDVSVATAAATTGSIDPDQVSIRGACQNRGNGVVQVIIRGSEALPISSIDHTTIRVGDARETHTDPRSGEPRLRVQDVDRDGYDDLIVHVRMRETGLTCATLAGGVTATVEDPTPAALGGVARSWPDARDLSGAEGISFWFEGSGSGEGHTFRLRDNAAPDPGPDGWELIWSDEFDQPAGTPPNPANWTPEIGDGTVNQIPGWGNDELQYYTDDPKNVRHDGEGNLVIEVHEVEDPRPDEGLQCYYGPCEYTSARLLTWHKQEFQYGRMEARVNVPEGAGYWPAFWALGTDIDEVPWPRAGEIDIMEFVGREPFEVFGTIHGPGYAGGQSFGNTFTTEEPVPGVFHTYAVEWSPEEIIWEFNDIRYHEAIPADVAPNEWVFEKPFFLLLNVAIGGNFGGPVGPDTVFPQQTLIDYVRVYGAPDTAERFETTFVDEVAGWQRVTIPFTDLVRSADQPEGAPDDGLTLTGARGYEVLAPSGSTFRIDDVRLELQVDTAVTSTADSGVGSLRSALAATAAGGTITIDPALAGETVELASPLTAARSVTIDASEAPGFTLDAGGSSRVLEVGGAADVTLLGGIITGGSHGLQGGAVRVAGALTLEDVTVVGNRTTGGDDFNHGGGAIYVTDGGRLEVVRSTLADNTSGWTGGAVWAGFDSEVTIVDSEVTGNTAADVAGALRTLGTLDVTGSTFTGNRASGWHGGALFVTDGIATVRGSTFDGNPGATEANTSLFVGTFTDASASLVLGGNTARNAGGEVCFLAPFGSGAVSIVSEGGNTFGDATCNPGPDDVVEPGVQQPPRSGRCTSGPTGDQARVDAGGGLRWSRGMAGHLASPLTDRSRSAPTPRPQLGARRNVPGRTTR
jgi:beta-glucanase (GH16 family)